jgi:methylthioribulose-1-phosphate dehydratase
MRSRTLRLARELARAGRGFYARGWTLGTNGNFSVVSSTRPFRLLISASGIHKGRLGARHFVECDASGAIVGSRRGKPSAETQLHLEIVRISGAAAVLHTHSVWSTMLSDRHAGQHGLAIEGYEMLKGLERIATHEHREWIPVFENDQDMERLAQQVRVALATKPSPHAFLLRRHGLYTWGSSVTEAERHVEILEFLLETVARTEEGTPWPR